MTRLTLVGPAEDGLHLTLASESGERFELPLSDALRHAVRYARPATRPVAQESDAGDGPQLSPRDIQQRIRGGLSAAELAELTGASLASIEKYEGPVIAERLYIATLARDTRIGRDAGAPPLGDLVTDRLAARGVDSDTVTWDAWREPEQPWQVAADYRVSGRSVRAVWSFDHTARTVTAADEEARWLSETELLDVPIPRRHLSAVRGAGEQAADSAGAAADQPLQESRPPAPVGDTPTEALLEDLGARRGSRDVIDTDLDAEDDIFEGFGPTRPRQGETGFTAPAPTHPAVRAAQAKSAAVPVVAVRAADAPAPSGAEEPAERRSAKRGRASVPSWDEIVFGAKNDEG